MREGSFLCVFAALRAAHQPGRSLAQRRQAARTFLRVEFTPRWAADGSTASCQAPSGAACSQLSKLTPCSRNRSPGTYTRPFRASSPTSRKMLVSWNAIPQSMASVSGISRSDRQCARKPARRDERTIVSQRCPIGKRLMIDIHGGGERGGTALRLGGEVPSPTWCVPRHSKARLHPGEGPRSGAQHGTPGLIFESYSAAEVIRLWRNYPAQKN